MMTAELTAETICVLLICATNPTLLPTNQSINQPSTLTMMTAELTAETICVLRICASSSSLSWPMRFT
jgi:hypothetical protein